MKTKNTEHLKNTKVKFFKPSVPKRMVNLNWEQSKARFPKLNPYGDIDHDGVKNRRDCKTFNIKRQGEDHDEDEISVGFGDIEKLKTVGDVRKLEESMLKRREEE